MEQMEPERLFSWRWQPGGDPRRSGGAHHAGRLRAGGGPEGTRLTVTETGFDRIPVARRAKAYRENEAGWTGQFESLRRYVARRRRAAASAPVFAALGDENRFRLLSRLGGGEPMSICRLTAGSGITRQGVTKHLRVLAGAGLVADEQAGKGESLALERRRLEGARRSLDLISRQWDESLGKLKLFVEG